MENGNKNISNGTSWFIWGGVAGVFAFSSRNTLAIVIFAIIACLLIFIGLSKRRLFNETYQLDDFSESKKEIDEPDKLLNDVNDAVIPEEKNDDTIPPEDH